MESNERSIVPLRVAGVSVALAGTGAILGGGLSAGLGALAGVALSAAGVAAPGASVLITAGIGAGLGAILTPLTALSILRQVALGKALLFTMLGMSAGVAGGQSATGKPLIAAAVGFGGFLVSALFLRLRARPKKSPAKPKPRESK